MRVRVIRNDLAGAYNLCYGPGEVIDLPDAQARELIETGHAEPVREARQIEEAISKAKPEKAVTRGKR